MARVPDDELARLKYAVPIERLADARGVVLRKRGQELTGLCPFHEDHSPSLVINPAKNLWHCLGACHTGGYAIDWVMQAEGLSFKQAVAYLQKEYSPLVARAEISQQVSNIKPLTEMKKVVSARPRKPDHHRDLHQGLHPQAQGNPHCYSSSSAGTTVCRQRSSECGRRG